MSNDCNGCPDNNIPTVNNTELECTEFYSANCVKTASYNSYFKIGIGKTLTYVIETIATYVKNLRQDVEAHHNYKLWEGLLSQTGAVAPTAVVGKNTLSGSIVWAYTGSGDYLGTLVGAFPTGKTFIYVGAFNKSWGEDVKAYRTSDDTIVVKTGSTTDFIDDDVLDNTPIFIKVYN